MQHFSAAPWPTSLKIMSVFATLLLLGVCWGAVRVIPPISSGFAHTFGTWIAVVPFCVLLGCVLFVVQGYRIEGNILLVERLLWATALSLEGLTEVQCDPQAIKGALRLFGNGGMFAITGLFYSKKLGRFRLFATDPAKAVILRLGTRTIVITPLVPEIFAEYVTSHMLRTGTAASGQTTVMGGTS